MDMPRTNPRGGFTIVELLIVIVVIAILAAISVVAYNGIQARANDSSVKDDFGKIAKAIRNYEAVKGTLPATQTALEDMNDPTAGVPEANISVNQSAYDVTTQAAPGDTARRNLIICVRAGGSDPTFGIAALAKSGTVWFYTASGGITESAQSWVGQQSTMCPRLGIATSDPGYSRSFGYERTAAQDVSIGWKDWTLGK